MAPEPIHSLHDELPAQGAWVRKLARGLVRDEASANDVAQETALAALRRPDAGSAPLRPWLARVARNFARRGWREASRRAARERAVARPEALPGADEAAERLEILGALVQELGALDPALQRVLLRRYFDGWSAARIARESDEPASTVRSRLQRALEELRRRLDQRSGGDRLRWRLALLPVSRWALPAPSLSESPHPPVWAGALQGVLTMKVTSMALAAGALMTAVGLGVWWGVGRASAPVTLARAEGNPPEARPAKPLQGEVESADAPPSAREAMPARSEAPAAARVEAAPPAAPEPASRLVGRVVDEDLVPLSAVRVFQVGEPRCATRTGADGAFDLDVLPGEGACTLRFEASGRATRQLDSTLRAGEAKELGDVVLKPGGRLRGRVFGPTGSSFEGADVSVTAPDLWGSLEAARVRGPFAELKLTAVSCPDGRFEVEGVGVGPMRAWAGAPGMRWAVSAPIEVGADQTTEEVELHLEPAHRDDRITGQVLSPEGEPVPHARLGCWEHAGGGGTSFSLETDSEGRFELAAKRGRLYDVSASDPAGRWSPRRQKGITPGTEELELRFAEARWIEIRALDSRGAPVESFEPSMCTPDGAETLLSANPAEHGGASAPARLLVPSETFLVRVDARGFRLADQGPFLSEEAPSELAFVLEPEPGVHGRVLSHGAPLAGARVRLFEAAPGMRIEHQGFLTLVFPEARDETRTDEEGRFTLKLRERGTYVVRAEAEAHAPADSGPLELAAEVGCTGLELALGRGGDLEGRVRVAPGRDPSGVIVSLNRGDGFPLTVRSDTEGRFGFEGLTPGPWRLARGRMEFNPNGGGTAASSVTKPVVLDTNCTIAEGETTYRDLDLTDDEPCLVAGLFTVNGAPASGWSVSGWPGAAQAIVGDLPSTATGADGRFELTVEEPGALRLSFSPPAEAGGAGRIDFLTEIRPGRNEWSANLSAGRLRGHCLSSLPKEELVLFYNRPADPEPSCWLPIQPDEDGAYLLPFVPAGKGLVRRADGGGRWTTLAETEVRAGEARVLDVP